MSKQGFKNTAGNPYIYQYDTISAAFGIDVVNSLWKLEVLNAAGATPTGTAKIIIDPAAAGNITLTPNGAGSVVISPLGLGVVLADATGALSSSGAGTAGQVLKSNGAGVLPTWQAETDFVWNEVLGIAQALAVQNAYVMNNVALITGTLPTVAAFGDKIIIVGKGAGGWKIAQNAGQTIHFEALDTTAGIGGSVASTNRYDCLELVCITANTDFVIRSNVGNLTIV